jgi:ATP-dependent DNA ligase
LSHVKIILNPHPNPNAVRFRSLCQRFLKLVNVLSIKSQAIPEGTRSFQIVKPRIAAPVRFSDFIEPMKALTVEKLPAGDWLYEIKFDGYRALAFKNGKEVRLVSRNQKTFNYPLLVDALKLLPAKHVILDGEIAKGKVFLPASSGV